MTRETLHEPVAAVARGLGAGEASTRLRAALSAGSEPHPDQLETLVQRCAVEPDFFVRDMLTWALTRHDRAAVTELLVRELGSPLSQARSQALHTLSKIAEPATWPAITTSLLQDPDDEVARAAWRAAVAIVPAGEESALAETLAAQLGRGGREVRLSLSRAFVALGDEAVPVLERASAADHADVAAHAAATLHLVANPDDGFDAAIAEAQRTVALLAAPRT